jgi:hypothetical protein
MAGKTKQNKTHSKSITSQEASLVVKKHGKCKKLARPDFSGVKGVVYLSSDYQLIHEPQIIFELCSVN